MGKVQITERTFSCGRLVTARYIMYVEYYPRANGAKRRSGRKPGARVTNRALGNLKVVGDGRRAKVIRFLALGMS